MSRLFRHDFDTEPKYSEADIVTYLESFMEKVMCGDYIQDDPWGVDANKQLYIAIFCIKEGELDKRICKDLKVKM